MTNLIESRAKRATDIAVSAALLAALAPLYPLVAAIIRCDSPGPALFRCTRVGLNGREFTMYKLRTMTRDAEARLAGLQHRNLGGPHLIRIPDDPRVTGVGAFLRRTGLDELPQLWNVLRGEMSLVGPRPQAPNEVALYTPRQRRRLSVLPGITGLWQVERWDTSDFEEWVRLDLAYIETWSLRGDVIILLRTAGVALGRLTGRRIRARTAPS